MKCHKDLIDIIIDQHDVSKHRKTISCGGKVRFDAPPDFWKEIAIDENN